MLCIAFYPCTSQVKLIQHICSIDNLLFFSEGSVVHTVWLTHLARYFFVISCWKSKDLLLNEQTSRVGTNCKVNATKDF